MCYVFSVFTYLYDTIPLWSRKIKNPDLSSGPLVLPFAHLFAPFTRLLAAPCSLCSRAPLHSLVRSFARSLTSSLVVLARGTVNDWIANLSVPFPFSLATYQLQNETQKLDLKEKVMATFLDKFQLTSDEVLALKGSPSPGSRIGNSNSSSLNEGSNFSF